MKRFGLITATLLSILGFVGAQVTIRPECAPSGTHLQTGEETCVCSGTTVDCTAFRLCGVGNTNADVALISEYTATVQCSNRGGQIVDVKSQDVPVEVGEPRLRSRNGCLEVPRELTTPPSASQFESGATCPNPNWTKQLLAPTIAVDEFTYTLTFAGFDCPYLTISGDCPASP